MCSVSACGVVLCCVVLFDQLVVPVLGEITCQPVVSYGPTGPDRALLIPAYCIGGVQMSRTRDEETSPDRQQRWAWRSFRWMRCLSIGAVLWQSESTIHEFHAATRAGVSRRTAYHPSQSTEGMNHNDESYTHSHPPSHNDRSLKYTNTEPIRIHYYPKKRQKRNKRNTHIHIHTHNSSISINIRILLLHTRPHPFRNCGTYVNAKKKVAPTSSLMEASPSFGRMERRDDSRTRSAISPTHHTKKENEPTLGVDRDRVSCIVATPLSFSPTLLFFQRKHTTFLTMQLPLLYE